MKINHIDIIKYSLILFLQITFFNLDGSVKHLKADQDNWQFTSQRKEIAPDFYVSREILFESEPTLAIYGAGKTYANGQWFTYMDMEPSQYFQFTTYFKYEKVEEPDRCILARIIWIDAEGQQVDFAEYPAVSQDNPEGMWKRIEQVYLVPEGTEKARIELIFRWDDDGVVYFGGISLTKVQKPSPRMVRLATVHFRPVNSNSPMENLEKFAGFIGRAAAEKADIVCLPESITMVGTGHDYISASEPVPGPSTEFLGTIAARYGLYIVAGILEREGPVVYNTAVLIDRKGQLSGKYRKTSLPREEIEGGVTPGNALPVFDTDFGRIGMMICWDATYPEQARTLARKGAEVIFLPIWGGFLTLTKARAIENQVFVVSSSYDMISAVFDQEGEIISEATDENPVAVVEVDLSQQKLWPWLGDFKNRIPREMPSKKALK